jgi:carbonic anhydrase
VIRNAGGVITDAEIHSLAISQRPFGTREIMLIHHASMQATTAMPGNFDDLEGDVRQSIARIKASPFIPDKDGVRGFVYDVKSARLQEVA